jgi:hypothetical protein
MSANTVKVASSSNSKKLFSYSIFVLLIVFMMSGVFGLGLENCSAGTYSPNRPAGLNETASWSALSLPSPVFSSKLFTMGPNDYKLYF